MINRQQVLVLASTCDNLDSLITLADQCSVTSLNIDSNVQLVKPYVTNHTFNIMCLIVLSLISCSYGASLLHVIMEHAVISKCLLI